MSRFALLFSLAALTALAGCAPRGTEFPPRAPEPALVVTTNARMVAVAAGEFIAGCEPARDPLCELDEQPMREVATPAFEIDVTEVTQGAYAACVRAGACTSPYHGPTPWDGSACIGRWSPRTTPGHPVACVTWDQASEFCSWIGKRLPTEWEWEKAARGRDGRAYPWGDEAPSCDRASIQRCKDVPVASRTRGRSPWGAYDLAGSVGEWTASEWSEGYFVVRGIELNATHVEEWDWRAANRFALAPMRVSHRIGFRCAR